VADVVPVNGASEDLPSVCARLGLRQGFDVGLEMSGNAAAFDQMVGAMVMGGRIAMLGIPAAPTLVDWNRIVFKSLVIKGIYGREIFETWYKMLAMLENGLDVSAVITHDLPMAEFERGFLTMKDGQSGKIVLDWN
ncbi:MAG: zinc-binding dehydrogenase, partial [Paracoccus sp. (in: a-proteobacteria)]|nr:zinc-binding dehydrogenase [Paracoccus sp. (in: a-proteobacteria)]